MTLENFRAMDPHLLVGLVNTELRNQADGLDDLCRTHDIPRVELIARLAEAGYAYREATRQFR